MKVMPDARKAAARHRLEIRNTGKYGLGVYAWRRLCKGERVHVLGGRRVTLEQMVDDVLSGREAINDPLQIGRRVYIDLDALSRLFNHGCTPNTGVRGRSELFALRDIGVGEELTYDYSQTVAPTAWHMECRCTAVECRGVIRDIRSIPKPQLDLYRRAGAIQRYLKPLLAAIEDGSYRVPDYEIRALRALGYSEDTVRRYCLAG